MKFLPPLVFALLTTACVAPAPQPGTAAHQRQLADEARENFYALKELERKSRPGAVVARKEAPKPAFSEKSRKPAPKVAAARSTKPAKTLAKAPAPAKRAASVKPLASGQPAKSRGLFKPADSNRLAKNRRNDDTVYYYDLPRTSEPKSARYRAYKRQYAEALGKSPEALTPKEREWVRMHYRN